MPLPYPKLAMSDLVFGLGHTFDAEVSEEGIALMAKVALMGVSFDFPVSDDGLGLIARWETEQLTRYKDASMPWVDPEGVTRTYKWTIGFGHQEAGDVEPKVIPEDMVLTSTEAWELLRADAENKARYLRKLITVPVTTPMFNALTSLTLNTGQGNLERGPVLPLLNVGKYIAACAAFVDPERGHIFASYGGVKTRNNGLIVRRATEMAHFMTKKD